MADLKRTNRQTEHVCHHLRRAQRQAEAAARQAARDKRTVDQQLAALATRPGESLREKRRIA